MWEQFTAVSVWVLIGAGILFTISLMFRETIRGKLSPRLRRKGKKGTGRVASVFFWIIESILFAIVVLSLVAVTGSQEGAEAMLTPESIKGWFLEHGTAILIIIIVAVALWALAQRFIPAVLNRGMVKTRGESREGRQRRRTTLNAVLTGLIKVIIIISAIMLILDELTVAIGPILAGFGIVGIAVGFGAQYLIRDLIAGVFIIMENQYRVGDVAKVADTIGFVEEITLRKTVLRDLDGIVHHVPNGEIRVASNYSRHFARVNLDVSVGYGTDLEYAISVINRVCSEMAEEEEWAPVIKSVPQVLRVNKLGDSGIDIKILGDVKPLEQWRVMGELRLRIKKTFDEAGIEIPWPHTKLYFGNPLPKAPEKE